MKRFLLFILLLVFAGAVVAQATKATADTVPAYITKGTVPNFSIQKPDSSWFTKNHLGKKPTLIIYFSPDCGHCQSETETVISNIRKLNNLQIVMITSRPFEDMVNFEQHYRLFKFPNIIVGQDPNYYVTRFFDVKFTPFSALYNKKGKLIKAYEQGLNMDEILRFIK